MEPILSKQEIADLLKSLQDGDTPDPRRLPFGTGKATVAHREISLFDASLTSEACAALDNFDIIIDRFGSGLSSSLSRSLQRSVTIESSGMRSTPFEDYLHIDAPGRASFIIEMAPLMAPAIVALDGALCSILLEFAMGGAGRQPAPAPDQPQSRLGLQILSTLLHHACTALDQSLKPVADISSSLIRAASDAELRSLIDSQTPVAIYHCVAQVESLSGSMDLIFPARAFEPLREALSRLTLLGDSNARRWSSRISDDLEALTINLAARSESLEISIRQLIDLKPGDILPIVHEPGAELTVLVEGVPKFSGMLVHENSRRSVRITDLFQTG